MSKTEIIEQGQKAPAEIRQLPVKFDAEALIAKGIEHNLPVDVMERLLAMRAQLKAEAAREAFFAALSAFQAECPVIPKDKVATVYSAKGQYQYHYAELATIGKAIAPLLKRYGLSYRFNTRFENDPPSQVVTCIVQHVDGHSETSEFRSPIDAAARMNEIQKSASSTTYGRRYALCNALGILTGDDDDDAQSAGAPDMPPFTPEYGSSRQRATPPAPKTISAAQHKRLEARINELGLDRERIKAWLSKATQGRVEHFQDMSQVHYEKLDSKLEEWAEQAAKGEADH